jgi:hypothetical protein
MALRQNIPNILTFTFFSAILFTLSGLEIQRIDIGRQPKRLSQAATTSTPQNTYIPLVQRTSVLNFPLGMEMRVVSDESGLAQIGELGRIWLRLNGVLWSEVEPVEGQRDWDALSDLDDQLIAASHYNTQMILVVRKTPLWAQKYEGYYCGPVRQEKFDAFADFMAALVRRYSEPPYRVKYWEIGNEPDVDPGLSDFWGPEIPYGCWGDSQDEFYGGGYYAEMLKTVTPRIKAADPEAKVLVGGLLMNCDPRTYCPEEINPMEHQPTQFLEGILKQGGGDFFDIVAFHAYDFFLGNLGEYGYFKWDSRWDNNGPLLKAKAGFIRETLNKYQVEGKQLMSTELALICGDYDDPPGLPPCESDWDSPYEITKANYAAQVYAASFAEGVQTGIWYSVSGWRNSGLLYPDLSPRRAYYAMKFGHEILGGLIYQGEVTSQDAGGGIPITGYKFQRDGREVWIVWSLDGGIYEIDLSRTPSAVWSVQGEAVNLSGPYRLTVTVNPVYIEWGP